jgi:ERCC4-type nuclease
MILGLYGLRANSVRIDRMMKLVVDSRETRLAEGLTILGVPFQTTGLDVGDFMIQNAVGEPLLVAERKSLADFAASNADGRYREQRARLMAVRGSGVAVLYILEGHWSLGDHLKMYGRTPEKQLQRLFTRLVLRYGMPVIQSEGTLDTARWAKLLMEQLSDDPTVFAPEGDLATSQMAAMAGMTAVLSTTKKGNKTPAGTAHAMLSAVPGLGSKKVDALLATHSIADLVALSAEQLSQVQVGGKKLGVLGPVIAESLRAKAKG